MRHSKKVNHLGRTSDHRKAMLANMATSLIMHKKIKTTVVKAKALRTYVEPLITKSKDDSTHSRRIVFSRLQNKDAVSELFREISPKIMERPGGYTRILKTGYRAGDSAEMCIIELVDYNENLLAAKSDTGVKAGKRRRRGSSKKKEEAETKTPKAETRTAKKKAETQTSEVKDEAVQADNQSATAETEKVETEVVAEATTEEVIQAAEENVPEDKPELKEEPKQDHVEDDEKKA
ncbi:MAG TPA: 50S ribosomal protein L17 [Bacteroidales bacterium]|nr:50S ribosomal protein L17 [Bacteroidales bacterium]